MFDERKGSRRPNGGLSIIQGGVRNPGLLKSKQPIGNEDGPNKPNWTEISEQLTDYAVHVAQSPSVSVLMVTPPRGPWSRPVC